jgi:hypothetical protein
MNGVRKKIAARPDTQGIYGQAPDLMAGYNHQRSYQPGTLAAGQFRAQQES